MTICRRRAKAYRRRARGVLRRFPVASSKGTSYFNDMLGTTVGSKSNGKYSAAALTAFGEGTDADKAFFTGKPMVEGLGHAFLMRNYRAGLAKWQTADPMGYPDGWNSLAYCNNHCCSSIDLAGANIAEATGEWNSATMFAYYLKAWGPNHLDTDDMGFTDGIYDIIMSSTLPSFKIVSLNTILPIIRDKEDDHGTIKVNGLSLPTGLRNPNFQPVCWALGKGTVWMEGYAECSWHDAWVGSNHYRYYDITINFSIRYYDIFEDIFTVRPKKPKEIGTPYSYGHEWYNQKVHLNGKIILE